MKLHRDLSAIAHCLIVLLTFAAVGALGGCTQFQALDVVVPSCGYTRTTDVPYGPHTRQKLDIYQPTDAKPNASVVVFFYGGYWSTGSKADYRFAAQALTSRGFIAILPDYRLFPDVTFPSFLEDGALAIRWTKQNIASFGGDPTHIYLMGHSAGAYIAAMLTLDKKYLENVGLDRSVIRATAALAGPYDFMPRHQSREVFNLSADDQIPPPDIEPINFVDGHEPPMLLLHGSKDTTVNPANAQRLAARIENAGGEVRCILYPHLGHVGIVLALAAPFRWLGPVLQDATDFFHEH